MVSHLETSLCPQGVRVWAVQSQPWIDACVDCGSNIKVFVKGSKSDFLFITQEGWDTLDALRRENIRITGEHVVIVLQEVLALYEVGGGESRWGEGCPLRGWG